MPKNKENRARIYTAQQVADYFLALGNSTGEPITNLRLQKLLYYAQAWHLANFKRPLFEDDFQAWVHGPVLPALYQKYKENGSKPIETVFSLEDTTEVFDSNTRGFLGELAEVYMPFNAWQLEQMTHEEDPWKITRGDLSADKNSEEIIPKKLMEDFYGARLRQN